MLKNKCCLYVIISIRFFSITICNLLIESPSYFAKVDYVIPTEAFNPCLSLLIPSASLTLGSSGNDKPIDTAVGLLRPVFCNDITGPQNVIWTVEMLK